MRFIHLFFLRFILQHVRKVKVIFVHDSCNGLYIFMTSYSKKLTRFISVKNILSIIIFI